MWWMGVALPLTRPTQCVDETGTSSSEQDGARSTPPPPSTSEAPHRPHLHRCSKQGGALPGPGPVSNAQHSPQQAQQPAVRSPQHTPQRQQGRAAGPPTCTAANSLRCSARVRPGNRSLSMRHCSAWSRKPSRFRS